MRAGKLAGAVIIGALALPASAIAGTATWAGKANDGTKVAFDAKIKNGKPKTITALRAAKLLLHCDISGDQNNSFLDRKNLGLAVRNNAFDLTLVQPTY